MSTDQPGGETRVSRLESVLRASPVGLYALDLNGRVTYVNDAAMRLTGLSEAPADGMYWLATVHPDDRGRVYKYWREVFQNKTAAQIEYRSAMPDGSFVSVLGECRPETNSDGTLIGWVGSVVDLSQRKHIEQALRESEEKFRQVANSAFVGLALVTDQQFTYANDALVQMFGYKPEDFAGRDRAQVAQMVPEAAQRAQLLEGLRRMNAVDAPPAPFVFEDLCLLHKVGSPRWVTLMITRLYPDRPMPRLMVCVDRTERKLAEEQLRKSQDLLRQTQRLALVGGWELDLRTNALHWTDEVRRIHEVPDDYQPDVETAISFYAPEYIPELKEALRAAREDGIPYRLEQELITAGGRRIWVRSTGEAVFEEGRAVRLIGAIQDITDLKRAEQLRRALDRRLQQSQKLESLGVLAGGIAHDFNNLLTAILGHAELAGMDIPPDSPARESLVQIDGAARRASDLAQQMLDYSGNSALSMQPLDVSAVVDGLRVPVSESAPPRAAIQFELESGLPQVLGDIGQLRQVIMNLVRNAWEALGASEGLVTLRTAPRRYTPAELHVFAPYEPEKPGPYAVIEVSDTGCGMDAATAARAFDPFFTTKFTGRGLGLAAALGIVRAHGGGIQIESRPGAGSTLRIALPARAETLMHPPRPAASARVPASRSGTILVVDDDPVVRNMASRALTRAGHRVLTAEDGRQALEVLTGGTTPVDAVLLDLLLPGISGGEVFAALAERGSRPPVVLMTGQPAAREWLRSRGDAAEGFLQKPFSLYDLREQIARVLD